LKPEDRFWLGSDQSVPIAKTTLPRTPIATLRFATMLPTEEEMRDTRWHALFEAVGYNLGHFGTDVQYFESPVPGEPDKDDPDRENIPTKHLNTYVLERLVRYRYDGVKEGAPLHGEGLLYDFIEDFRTWTVATFTRLDKDLRVELRRVLRERGIYTGEKGRIDQQLATLANSEDDVPREADEVYKKVLQEAHCPLRCLRSGTKPATMLRARDSS
jgi:hypothetical protein